jgi:hypothetical protein
MFVASPCEVGFNGAKHAFTLAGANHLSKQALPVAHTCICCLLRQCCDRMDGYFSIAFALGDIIFDIMLL